MAGAEYTLRVGGSWHPFTRQPRAALRDSGGGFRRLEVVLRSVEPGEGAMHAVRALADAIAESGWLWLLGIIVVAGVLEYVVRVLLAVHPGG